MKAKKRQTAAHQLFINSDNAEADEVSVVAPIADPPLADVVHDAAVGAAIRPVAIVDWLPNEADRPLNQFDFYNPAEIGSYLDTTVPLADNVRERCAREVQEEFDAYSAETTYEINDN